MNQNVIYIGLDVDDTHYHAAALHTETGEVKAYNVDPPSHLCVDTRTDAGTGPAALSSKAAGLADGIAQAYSSSVASKQVSLQGRDPLQTHLTTTHAFIEPHSPPKADKYAIDALSRLLYTLADSPEKGRPWGLEMNSRELPVPMGTQEGLCEPQLLVDRYNQPTLVFCQSHGWSAMNLIALKR